MAMRLRKECSVILMRMRPAVLAAAIGMVTLAGSALSPLAAQSQDLNLEQLVDQQRLPAPPGDPRWRNPPTGVDSAAAGNVAGVIWNWRQAMGMLRGIQEIESIATLEIRKSKGTLRVDGQPCRLTNYRAGINYQVGGMRAEYACTLPTGRSREGIEVLSGRFAWDEDEVGAGLIPGRGTPTPKPDALTERIIRLWAGPQGAVKAAWAGGEMTKVALEGDKIVVTFPIPGVQGATAKATLNANNRAERVEVRNANVVTEFTYEKYSDYNPADDRIDVLLPGRIVEKRDGVTILDLQVDLVHAANMYIAMPVPKSIAERVP